MGRFLHLNPWNQEPSNPPRKISWIFRANIAEGYGRKTIGEYTHFLYIAYGSECELETQIQLCNDLGYLKSNDYKELQDKIKGVERMLKALIRSLDKKNQNPWILEPPNPWKTTWENVIRTWFPILGHRDAETQRFGLFIGFSATSTFWFVCSNWWIIWKINKRNFLFLRAIILPYKGGLAGPLWQN